MKAAHHAEQVVGGGLLVGQDVGLQPSFVAGLPEEPRLDIGREPLLAGLQHQGPHLARRGPLRLQPVVQVTLGALRISGWIAPDLLRIFRQRAA